MIRYAHIIDTSVVDGLGIRVTAFLQGCPRACPGCHNPELQAAEGGSEVSPQEFSRLLLQRVTPLHRGITFSGGDPLLQAGPLQEVIDRLKNEAPRLDIWVYTGYTWEEVAEWPVLDRVDVLVDGPFLHEQRDLSLPFRGSRNQRVIDVQASRQRGQVVEVPLG
ncbi:MAG: anaerobic ribonucleoside-triphosphate reductase activating protein [Syntrophomonadaceae bacterium]|nr:anaerobic ribonucleoside-triphosphate reductase activating protein [Syntrophomonadaceae bacterium]MDH7498306.1 anaerobic ribonucleoside-triphosphate reductase activating protein [Syntrophomonadaceae bacterium]